MQIGSGIKRARAAARAAALFSTAAGGPSRAAPVAPHLVSSAALS
jgi:hypothetical protein